ncbi:MAG: Ig-like domain-containing protein [Gammaproteobacteria bacterium]|nr:Ig-like domain-containing protein [Gammaproteobacteria bacterium]MBU6508900.1 Ig-like domain-containing protein [Gammaproteobacteria bacterium]MDE1983330.1 Ig-like domain-containing protein [Gammaproteobacteria bacterium]MDE2108838.1 Ig-like domain-containing protein [Gammaproteobacteria bacterium]MDE2461119.1 Ig-like domain-containing protein [Gammaproteobacteria bacterium]
MDKRALLIISTIAVALTACVHGNNSTTNATASTAFQARYAPLSGIGPFPNDLYFNGSTTGTLNIPFASTSAAAAPANAALASMNHLDGYGTQSVINAYFTEAIDPASLNAGDVFVFKVTANPQNKAIDPTKGATPLVPGADCSASTTDYTVGLSPAPDSGGTVLDITPCKPLAGGSTYLVILTNGIKDTNGDAAAPSADYSLILAADLPVLTGGSMGTTGNPQLDQVALFTLPQLAVAAGAKINPQSIVLTFSFSTQYVGDTLSTLAANATATAQPQGTGIVFTGLTVAAALQAVGQTPPPVAALANLYAGDVALPYYSAVPTAANPGAPLTGFWHTANGGDTTVLSPLPTPTVAQNVIPILVTIPNSASGCTQPASGWKTVIFQHGITQNRENVLAIGGSFASQCFAVVAIDLPLHGVTNTSDPLYQKGHERTFDLPEVAPFFSTPSSTIAPSGSYFINLGSLLTSRDNLREGAADLINLTATLPTLVAVNSPTNPTVFNKFDASELFYVGHSLGAMVGIPFLAVDGKKIVAATLASPGGDIGQMLLNSPTFAPQINAGLEAAGLTPGTQFYDDYFRSAQAVIDDGDPANYAAGAAANDPIHMLEVVGGFDACSVPDTVVPNSATNLLNNLMGLTAISSPGPHPISTGHGALVQFTSGDHGSLLSPAPPAGCASDAAAFGAVTTEMQSEAVSLGVTNGAAVVITSNTYIK